MLDRARRIEPPVAEVVMHQIVEPPKPNPASPASASRRTLLEGTASAGFVAAAAGCGSAALRPHDAHAADPAPGAWSPRQIAAAWEAAK
jgi:hypothetical protein